MEQKDQKQQQKEQQKISAYTIMYSYKTEIYSIFGLKEDENKEIFFDSFARKFSNLNRLSKYSGLIMDTQAVHTYFVSEFFEKLQAKGCSPQKLKDVSEKIAFDLSKINAL